MDQLGRFLNGYAINGDEGLPSVRECMKCIRNLAVLLQDTSRDLEKTQLDLDEMRLRESHHASKILRLEQKLAGLAACSTVLSAPPAARRVRGILLYTILRLKGDKKPNLESVTPYRDSHASKFTHIFGEDARNSDIFAAVSPTTMQRLFGGGTALIGAYGQSGAGKSWTMMSTRTSIIPRAFAEIFSEMKRREGEAGPGSTTFYVQAWCVEEYSNRIRDLLPEPEAEESTRRQRPTPRCASKTEWEDLQRCSLQELDLMLKESPSFRSSTKARASKHRVLGKCTMTDLNIMLLMAQKRRATAPTGMNDKSSRSHVLMGVSLHAADNGESERDRALGTLCFLDLCGTEDFDRLDPKSSEPATANLTKRRGEFRSIHKSLMAFRNLLGPEPQQNLIRGNVLAEYLRPYLDDATVWMVFALTPPGRVKEDEELRRRHEAKTLHFAELCWNKDDGSAEDGGAVHGSSTLRD